MLVVDTNLRVPDAISEVRFEAFRDEAPTQGQEVPALLGDAFASPLPLTLALKLKEGADEGPFTIVVSGYRTHGGTTEEPVVRRKARVSFQRGRVLSLAMHLVQACAGDAYRTCEAQGKTCTEAGCRALDAVLEPWQPGAVPTLFDAGAVEGGGPVHHAPDDAGETAPDGAMADGGSEPPIDAGSTQPRDSGPEPLDGEANIPADHAQQLALGEQFSCARMSSGAVYCWGKNDLGQLGDNATHQGCATGDCSSAPVRVVLLEDVSDLAAGATQACAVHAAEAGKAGNVKCWGDGNPAPRSVTRADGSNVSDARSVHVGGRHACYMSSEARAFCWGGDIYGQIGDGTPDLFGRQATPVLVTTSSTLVASLQLEPEALRCGKDHTCLRASGEVLCWGDSTYGQCGTAPLDEAQPAAVHLAISSPATEHATGGGHSCAIADGEVWCWGDNSWGQLGHAESSGVCQGRVCDMQPKPLDPALPVPARRIVAGHDFTCALLEDGRVFCWGDNEHRQLGASAPGHSAVAVEVLGGVAEVVAGHSHACAILAESHDVRCWGANESGQLGPHSTLGQPSSSAVHVPLPE